MGRPRPGSRLRRRRGGGRAGHAAEVWRASSSCVRGSEMRVGRLPAGEERLRPGTEKPHGLRRSRAVLYVLVRLG
jgi:hypothetical protein